MVLEEGFGVEEFTHKYETKVDYNLAEACCYSLSLNDVYKLTGEKFEINNDSRFTYGAIDGTDNLRGLVADLYSDEKVKFTKDNVLITNGGIGANFLVYYTLFGKGDHVICVSPTYQQLFSVPKMFGADVELLRLQKENGFVPSVEQFKKLIKPNTKAFILNNPNNPIGSVMETDLLEEITKVAQEHGITIISDEVYRPLFHSSDRVPKSVAQLSFDGISTGSMSKAFAFAGVRLGWIVSQNTDFLKAARSKRHYNIISISMIDDQISQYVLQNKKKILQKNKQLCLKNLDYLSQWVKINEKVEFLDFPKGGSVCLIKIDGISDTQKFATWLAENKSFLVVPGETFQCPGTLRLGYANSEDDVAKGLEILSKSIDEYKEEK
ncbi:hypothetical protein ACO0RG_004256 [Hanseniaspora osmophila]|uniref:Aspartate aminotransferase n=1 Tax=Hanseniaspora osmophila TaxID=56408 RepID=A0A1E5RBL7_9ASCO|nr:Aspartate aminotransferase [Hanseniaspora osmophila]